MREGVRGKEGGRGGGRRERWGRKEGRKEGERRDCLLITCRHSFVQRPHAHCIDVPPLHKRMYIVVLHCRANVT